MKSTTKKGATKSARAFTSKVAPKPATKPPKNIAKPSATKASLQDEVQSALKWLKSHSTKATLDGMARYALPSNNALGVAYRDIIGRHFPAMSVVEVSGLIEDKAQVEIEATVALSQ